MVRLSVAHSLAIDAHTAAIVTALRAADIPSVLLKGPATARWLYTDGSPRPYCDTDLLVPDHLLHQVEQVLGDIGLVPSSAPTLDRGVRPHATNWARPDGSGAVDLHWTIPEVGALERAWSVVWRDAEPAVVAGCEVHIGSEPLRALHIALHALHHGPAGEKSLEDLRRAVQQVPRDTWVSAVSLAEELDAVPAMALGLQLVPEGAVLAERLGIDATGAAWELLLLAQGAPTGAHHVARLAAQPTWRRRVRVAVRLAFPSAAYVRAWDKPAGTGGGGIVGAYWRRVRRGTRGAPAAARAYLRRRRAARR